jgi:DNA repair exonuclease SbcCD ATPase subunit
MSAESAREYSRRWRAANREKYLEAQRRRRAANPEKQREYGRRYRAAHLAQDRERSRRYYAAHADEQRAQARDRARRNRQTNPERVRELGRAALRLNRHGLRWEDWLAMRDAQDGRCYLCNRPLPEDSSKVYIDHDHRCCPRGFSCRSCRRGLTHIACNTLIGLADDDPARLRQIAANLAKAKRRLGRLPKPPTLFDLEKP